MKNCIIIIVLLTSTVKSVAQQVRMVQGQIVGLNTGKVYLYKTGLFAQGPQLVDSTRLSGQLFYFKRLLDEPGAYFMSIDEAIGQFHFVWDKDLFVVLDADNLNQSLVEDSSLNQTIRTFSDTTAKSYEQRMTLVRQTIAQAQQANNTSKVREAYEAYFTLFDTYKNVVSSFVELHKQEWSGLFILSSYHKDLGRQLTLDLLSVLNPVYQKSQLATKLKSMVSDSTYLISP